MTTTDEAAPAHAIMPGSDAHRCSHCQQPFRVDKANPPRRCPFCQRLITIKPFVGRRKGDR